MGNFFGWFKDRFNNAKNRAIQIKEVSEIVGKDMWTYVVPLIISCLIGLKDFVPYEQFQSLMYIPAVGLYSWLAYRFCQIWTKKKEVQINQQTAIMHAVIKAIIIVLVASLGYFLLTFIPIINLLENIPFIGTTVLFYIVIAPLYLLVLYTYPIKCN
jgi:uncharacterized protein YacL